MSADRIDLQELYQEVILDHNKRPRNFRAIEHGQKAEGYNPLCGDRLTVYLRVEDGRIQDASFQGSGCAISKASASLMTDSVKGKTLRGSARAVRAFHRMITRAPDEPVDDLGKLSVLAGVRQFPVRVKCASLPWHTLRCGRVEARDEVVIDRMKTLSVVQSSQPRPAPPRDTGRDRRHDVNDPERLDALRPQIVEALSKVFDPEIPVNIYELGLIYDIIVDERGRRRHPHDADRARVSRGTVTLPLEVKKQVAAIPGVTDVKVDVVWDPPVGS